MSQHDWVWISPSNLHGGRRLCLAPFGKPASEALPFITKDGDKLDVSASAASPAACFCGLMPITEVSIYADVSALPAHLGEEVESPLWISYKNGLGQIAVDGIYIVLGMGHMLMDRSRSLLGVKQEA